MRYSIHEEPREPEPARPQRARKQRLPVLIWLMWALLVLGTGYASWSADRAAGRPANLVGVIVHSVLAGVLGLLVLTWLEIRLTG